MLAATTFSPRNQLLRALPQDEFQELLPNLKRVEMPLGKVLYEIGEPIKQIYFPETSIVSTVTFFEDGASIETGITGNEGMTGIPIALSQSAAPRETMVQAAGLGWQISAEHFRREFEYGGMLQHLSLRYVFAFFEQVAQSGACINHHPVSQRLARWMLMCHDRTEGDELRITHDFIAQMLGVNRPSVTGAAIELKEAGLISYSRGVIKILDRNGLEAHSCECYESIRSVYDKFLSLVELRHLSDRMEQAQWKLAAEMKRREKIVSTTRESIEKLQRAVSNIRNLAVRIRVCTKCQRICDARNNPRRIDEYLGQRINAEFMSVTCSVCAQP